MLMFTAFIRYITFHSNSCPLKSNQLIELSNKSMNEIGIFWLFHYSVRWPFKTKCGIYFARDILDFIVELMYFFGTIRVVLFLCAYKKISFTRKKLSFVQLLLQFSSLKSKYTSLTSNFVI